MYLFILLIVLSSLTSMFLSFQYEKNKQDDKEKIKDIYYVYFSSLLMGSLGVLFAVLMFNFKKEDKKFVLINLLILLVQIIITIFIIKYN